ncbi:MAG: DNA polymerase III subunit gamma/tau [Bacteroidaceae bacterium]|nr:DNA polymerase III subunit gamma/tau [Bacteroidaceae bacterium]MBR1801528.1 DNA polymerase III subunit gamma/tau [Bacteroidaceae bacterium]
MSEYIVSARKYRPMTFDTVVGQGSIATTLKNAIHTGKLAHAYLFCGPRGVGKTTCARIFAKTINCLNPRQDGEACNECESCQAFNEQRSMNIHELDAASNNSVDDIRALIDQVRIPPQIGKYKVFIIDEVHMLSTSAFNAFLKTLEEPPAHAIFILATTEKHKILPTILSRCQIYDFQRMSVENTVRHLAHVAEQEGYTFEPAALTVIAQKADGGMRDALSIFDQVASYSGGNLTYQRVIENLNVLDYDYYFRLVDLMLEKKIPECMLLYNEILSRGFDGAPFISGLAAHLRDLLVSHDPQTTSLLEVSDDIRQRYQQQAQRCKVQWLYRAIRLCNDCDQAYRTSRNKRLQVELTLIECAQATDDDPGAGRRPARILKPIFNLQAAAALEATPAAPRTQPTPDAGAAPRPAIPHQPAAQTPASPSPASSAARPWATAPSSTPPAKRKVNLGSMLSSIRISQPAQPASSTADPKSSSIASQPTAPAPQPAANQPVDASELYFQWHQFIATMPQSETAIAQRMRIMQPVVNDAASGAVSLTLDNKEVLQMMMQVQPRLEGYLRQQLHNSQLSIKFDIAAQTVQTTRVYDKHEQLRHLTDINPALAELKQLFQLELE